MPHQKRACNYIHPKQHSPFPERLKLPYLDEEISASDEEDVSFIRDGFTTWAKADFETILERHAVDIRNTLAENREASARRHDTYSQEYHFENNVPNRSPVQQDSASTAGTQDPDVEEKALLRSKSQASGTSSDCKKLLSMLTTSFSCDHYGGCGVLFNKDTFFPDVTVKSIYLHDIRRVLPDKVVEGESGWVIQGVLSRASFRRQPLSSPKSFKVMSLYINNNFAKKKSIRQKLILTFRVVMLEENMDAVAGEFNGASWRRDDSANSISNIEEAVADCALPMPPGLPPLW